VVRSSSLTSCTQTHSLHALLPSGLYLFHLYILCTWLESYTYVSESETMHRKSHAGCTACVRGRRGMATQASASGGKRISQNEFTEKAWQSIIAAPDIAQNASQQIVDTEHLFKALLEQPNGLARRILAKAGSNPTQLLEKTDQYIRQQPRVTGDSSQVGLLTHQPVLFCMCQRALSDLAAAAVLT